MNRLLCLVCLCALPTWAAEVVPGQSLFGERRFIEYVPGDLPIVFAAPHGGFLEPDEIPNRKVGVTVTDANTQALARTIAGVIHERTGHHPHLILCLLQRGKLDANREIVEAAAGQPLAEQAWREHHQFIDQACAAAVAKFGFAFFIDVHGHAHPSPRVELGYMHSIEDLTQSDEALSSGSFAAAGTLALIAVRKDRPYAELLRGKSSLGALLEARGFKATPSPSAPTPVVPYFRGGYTVARHCKVGEKVAGLQLECHRPGLRDTAENRVAFARALVGALEQFLSAEFAVKLNGDRADPTPVPAAKTGAR